MLSQESNVLILKPTAVFSSFLSDHLPAIANNAVRNTSYTAYTFSKKDSDDATLAEIERFFPAMFKHEIQRFCGDCCDTTVDVSFLDFLCCFKFELHSQIVLMEPSMQAGKQLLCVKPRLALLHWMKSSNTINDWIASREALHLSDLTDNSTILVKNFGNVSEFKQFIQHYYRPLVKAEMFRLCDTDEHWPEITSLEMFNRYFSVQRYTDLMHLH